MKNIPEETKIFLASATEVVFAYFYTFTLANGDVKRYLSVPGSITANGFVFGNGGPVIKDGGTTVSRGITTGTLELTIGADNRSMIGTAQFVDFVKVNGLTGSMLRSQVGFQSDWPTMRSSGPVGGLITRFYGRYSKASEFGSVTGKITYSTPTELLDQNFPAWVFMSECNNQFGDSMCGVNPSNYAMSGAVNSSVVPGESYFGTNLVKEDDYFSLGRITFVTGANAGQSASVRKQAADGTISTVPALPNVPVVGDTFIITPGCPLTFLACGQKFNNSLRFAGFPNIPDPNTGLVS